ncbi:tripartite tricarboxylate transporter permease [Pseudoruegeria sp. HB172150]|uniref:tripartite tricarboxylate transporter permease n=1 Tax=Pseudoruegeria sp. HB172150 TaxID=2721164 RepID=UPI001552676E|nr:tripartite tricarboxylate transporter permease [Pseudoruegeria sp. HB172150]
MNTLDGLIYGLGVATQPVVLFYCFFGVFLGTFIGVLPGVGALAAISLLLPITFYMPPEAALVMLAGVYYGAQYGGSIASILLRLPGTPQSAVTALEGYPLARQGKAGAALFVAMSSSFIGSILGIAILVLFAPLLAQIGTKFGAAEYFSMMLLGLVAASTVGSEAPAKAMAMVVVGMILGCVGADVNSGALRFTFGQTELLDGVNLVALAMGLFGISEVISNVRTSGARKVEEKVGPKDLLRERRQLKRVKFSILRGTGLGAFFGALPGTGGTIATFLSYAVERKVSRHPEEFGKGAVEGIAGPESANNSAAITAFIPTLTLGIPGDVIMALMLGAMIIHGVQPGPLMLVERPEMFWGLIASFGIGNLFLIVLNLPLIGIWVALLRIPFSYLYPAITVFVCLGVYSVRGSAFDVMSVVFIGAFGYIMALMRFNPALLLLGFVLGPLIETNLRRALLLSRGDLLVFFERPISAVFLSATILLIGWGVFTSLRKIRRPVRQEAGE